MSGKVGEGSEEPTLGVGRCVDASRNPREHHGACAHGAGFERDVQSRIVEAPVLTGLGSRTERVNFGVTAWVVRLLPGIDPGGYAHPIDDDESTYRNLTLLRSMCREREGLFHPVSVGQ